MEQERQARRTGRPAILFLHGILGDPRHFLPFFPLIPEDWTVKSVLLQGHGGTVQDFSAASMAEWKRQAHEALQTLREEHDRVVIAAHSMGTLFAIQEAVSQPVSALFLLNVPLRIRLTPRLFQTAFSVYRGNIPQGSERLLAAQRAYSIAPDKNPLHYAGWIPRYLELFSLIRETRPMTGRLAVPCRIYLSAQDEMVSPAAGRAFDGNGLAKVKTLAHSGHYYYAPDDLRLLQRDFQDLLRQLQEI